MIHFITLQNTIHFSHLFPYLCPLYLNYEVTASFPKYGGLSVFPLGMAYDSRLEYYYGALIFDEGISRMPEEKPALSWSILAYSS